MSKQGNKGGSQADEVRNLLKELMNADATPISGKAAPAVQEPVPQTIPLRENPPLEGEQPAPAPGADTPEEGDLLPYLLVHDEESAAEFIGDEDEYMEDPVYIPHLITAEDVEDEEEDEDSLADMPLLVPEWSEERPDSAHAGDGNDLPLDEDPPAPRMQRRPLAAIGGFFAANFPHKGDSVGEWVRKCVFWLALAVLVVSCGCILYQVWWQPMRNAQVYDTVEEIYQPDTAETLDGDYPDGMLASFKELYDINPEVRGFLDYSANSQKDFLDIHYPVMYSGDNTKYLKTDFYGNHSKSGALFFDERNRLEPDNHNNKVLVVYGHNMASGQMFAGLNKLIGNLQNARSAATMTLSTLYEKNEYKVLAVVLMDEDEDNQWYYDCCQTYFSTNGAFLEHIDALRARSLFDYPVDVIAGDQLLVLSTCTAYSSSKLHDGRLVVVARKVRSDESAAVDASTITRNEDVIMPRAWYTNQNLSLHPYYTETGYKISEKRYTTTTAATTTNWTLSEEAALSTETMGVTDVTGDNSLTSTSTTATSQTGTTAGTQTGTTVTAQTGTAATETGTTSTAQTGTAATETGTTRIPDTTALETQGTTTATVQAAGAGMG